jgi:NAD(P)-dependent dehydrogenase (short-subunit alcohol dehydrogenase family)
MPGKTVIITGASDGIGAAAARRLRRAGDNVVVVGRSPEKTRAIADELDTDHFVVDFADLAAVRGFVDDVRNRYSRIDVLANNAGAMAADVSYTPDGFEKLLQVNYLAPFLVTTGLLDLLSESGARVVTTSSASHKLARPKTVDELLNTAEVGSNKAYALTKLALVLFTRELHRRHHERGISAVAFHPGWVRSNIGPASGSRLLKLVHRTPFGLLGKQPDEGAEQLVLFANETPGRTWHSGDYFSGGKPLKAARSAYDDDLARDLWDRTTTLVAT